MTAARVAALVSTLLTLTAAGPATSQARDTQQQEGPVDLVGHVAREITIEGRVSRVPWQHLIGQVRGKQPEYFDLDDRSQIVVFSARPLPATGRLRLTGTVLKVEGGPKRPGSKAGDSDWVEYQLDVTHVEQVAEAQAPTADALEALLERLPDPELSFEDKHALRDQIIRAGKAAIPVLIAHLADTRVCGSERQLVNENLLLNRPPHQPAPEPIERVTPVQVGQVCRRLLYRIVTPAYRPTSIPPFKPRSLGRAGWLFEIADWPAWWKDHARLSLAEIHAELKPVIDRYYETRGEVQVVR